MTGYELEELRKHLNVSIEDFAGRLGISHKKYLEYLSKNEITEKQLLERIVTIELECERENLDKYEKNLLRQPTGPFAGAKILNHINAIADLKNKPDRVAPITVEIHLSNQCNQACPFCTFNKSVHTTSLKDRLLDTGGMEALLNDMKKMDVKSIVYSGGGEPLVHPEFTAVVNQAAAREFQQGLITNGMLLDEDKMKSILRSFKWVRISADAGSNEVYEKTHGKGEKFDELLDRVKTLVAMKKELNSSTRIGVSFLLNMINYNDLLYSCSIFRDTGVDYFQVKPMVMPVKQRIKTNNIFWRENMVNYLSELSNFAVPGKFDVYTLGFKFVDMFKHVRNKTFTRCWGHPFYPTITATGDVYVCCLKLGDPKYCYGNVFKEGFYNLWFSEKRFKVGRQVKAAACPINCKLSETNKVLENILGKEYKDKDFLN